MALPGFEDSGRIAEEFRGLGVSSIVLVCIQGMEFSQDLGFGVRGLDRRQ